MRKQRHRMIKKLTWRYLVGQWWSQDLSPGKVGCRFHASNLCATFPITYNLVKLYIVSPVKALFPLHSWPAYDDWNACELGRTGFVEIFGGTWKVCTRMLGASNRTCWGWESVITEINEENQFCLLEQEIPSQACLASCHLASSEASSCPLIYGC